MTDRCACDASHIPSQKLLNPSIMLRPIPRMQMGQTQVSEYQEGGRALCIGLWISLESHNWKAAALSNWATGTRKTHVDSTTKGMAKQVVDQLDSEILAVAQSKWCGKGTPEAQSALWLREVLTENFVTVHRTACRWCVREGKSIPLAPPVSIGVHSPSWRSKKEGKKWERLWEC